MATIKRMSHSKGFYAILTACLVFSIIAATLLSITFPSADVTWQSVSDLRKFYNSLPSGYRYDYAFVDAAINMATITSNWQDSGSNMPNIKYSGSLASNFKYKMNFDGKDDGFSSGIIYTVPNGKRTMGDYELDGYIQVRIPYGVIARDAETTPFDEDWVSGERYTTQMGYYDIRVTFSDIVLGLEEDVDAGTELTFFMSGFTENKVYASLKNTWPKSLFLRAMKSPDNEYHHGWQCTVKIEVIESKGKDGDWTSASAVSGKIPMAYDDIDMPDWVTANRAMADRTENEDAKACWKAVSDRKDAALRDGHDETFATRFARMGLKEDRFGEYNLYNGPYKESITFVSGHYSNYMYTYDNPSRSDEGDDAGRPKSTTLISEGNRVFTDGNGLASISDLTDAAIVFMADASGSTIKWSGSHCGTKLFMPIGVYTVTIIRDDTYGVFGVQGLFGHVGGIYPFTSLTDDVNNPGYVIAGSMWGQATVFPRDDFTAFAEANHGFNFDFEYFKVDKDGDKLGELTDSTPGVLDRRQWTFYDVEANHEIHVKLKRVFTVTTEVVNGWIDPVDGYTDIAEGSNKTVKYGPNDGYMLSSITITNLSQKDEDGNNLTWDVSLEEFKSSYRFTDIHANYHIKVVYKPMPKLYIESISTTPSMTDDNKLYHFAGLTYIVKDANDNVVATIPTVVAVRDGSAVLAGPLAPGKYTIWSTNNNLCYKEAINTGEEVTVYEDRDAIATMKHPPVDDPITIVIDKDWE